MKLIIGTGCVLLSALTGACGGDASAEAGSPAERTAAVAAVGATGELTLNGERHDFLVRSCYLDGEYDSADEDYTLSGAGEMAGGARFSVNVGRSNTGLGVQHEVTLRSSGTGEPLFLIATRERTSHGWVDAHAPEQAPDEPLVTIDGKTVRAMGYFASPMQASAPVLEATIEATCP